MAGKEVIFHEKAISAHGWTGHGYIMVDPNTGAGAYIIEGRGNGGNLGIEFAALAGLTVIGLFGSPLFILIMLIISAWVSIMLFFITYEPCGNAKADDLGFTITMFSAIATAGLGLIGKIGNAIMVLIGGWIYTTGPLTALSGSCNK